MLIYPSAASNISCINGYRYIHIGDSFEKLYIKQDEVTIAIRCN